MRKIGYESAKKLFSDYGFDLTEDQFEKFCIYEEYLLEYNEHANLTAITEPKDILIKHFLDSVLLLKYAEIPENASLLDVGTGAGFPAIPLKIMRNDLEITMLDSLNKRIVFLDTLCEKLNLDCDAMHGRAEELGHSEFREQYDVVTARAVAQLPKLCEFCIPFVRKGGIFVAMKGKEESPEDCKNANSILGTDCTVTKYELEGDQRQIFVMKKKKCTPNKYPRQMKKIKESPL